MGAGRAIPRDEVALLLQGERLGVDAADLRSICSDCLAQLSERLLERVEPGGEQAFLSGHQGFEFRASGGGLTRFREDDRLAIGALGLGRPRRADFEYWPSTMVSSVFSNAPSSRIRAGQVTVSPSGSGFRRPRRHRDAGRLTALLDLDLAAGDDGAGDARRPGPDPEPPTSRIERGRPDHRPARADHVRAAAGRCRGSPGASAGGRGKPAAAFSGSGGRRFFDRARAKCSGSVMSPPPWPWRGRSDRRS